MKFKNTAIHPVSMKVENSRKMKGIGGPRSVASARFSQTMALKQGTVNSEAKGTEKSQEIKVPEGQVPGECLL